MQNQGIILLRGGAEEWRTWYAKQVDSLCLKLDNSSVQIPTHLLLKKKNYGSVLPNNKIISRFMFVGLIHAGPISS